ncbi:MAG: PilZ domain-containing protein [Spirochaetales bacterium]
MQRVQKEFVLKSLVDSETEIVIHAQSERVPGVLVSYDRETLVVALKEACELDFGSEVNVYFSMNGHVMTFRALVRGRDAQERPILSNPDAIYRRLERSHERIRPETGVSVRVFLPDGALELDFPRSERSQRIEEDIKLGYSFNPANISSLMRSFRERASMIAAETKIVMFRGRKPHGMAEDVIVRSGKILVLPLNVSERLKGTSVSDWVLSDRELITQLYEDAASVRTIARELQSEEQRLRSASIQEEMYCPVLFREYAIGYIYLLQTAGAGEFTPSTVEFVRQFARILAYALNANGYFEGGAKPKPRAADLIDISASGVLFAIQDGSDRVTPGEDINLEIDVSGHTIPAKGRIVRSYSGQVTTYVAVRFVELTYEDAERLMTGLYGRDYNGGIDLDDRDWSEEQSER